MYHTPKMILFDYGQTLLEEEPYEAMRGNKALLQKAMKNPEQITAESMQEVAEDLLASISKSFSVTDRNVQPLEITDFSFNRYLYEYLGIEFSVSDLEIQKIFWDNAAPAHPTNNIAKLLAYLKKNGIRTAVVSNMMYSKEVLRERLNRHLPDNEFEFILTSCDYVFRKPNPRIFELAIKKSGLKPEEIWFCGDNLICDVEGSHQMGLNPIWYQPYRKDISRIQTDATFVTIQDWSELMECLEQRRQRLLRVDKKDYDVTGTVGKRIAVRGVVKKNGKYALIHSAKYGEYKFPGGGMKPGERKEETLIREVLEETGLKVIPESIKFMGNVEEVRKGDATEILKMLSCYYLCNTEEKVYNQNLDDYEADYGYRLEWITLEEAIANNKKIIDTEQIPWVERDTRVMEVLMENSSITKTFVIKDNDAYERYIKLQEEPAVRAFK